MPSISPRIEPAFARLRDDYPILHATTYLNSNSMGALSRSARRGLTEYADSWEREGVEAWGGWARLIEETADAAAALFNGGQGRTALNQNVSFFQTALATCFDWSGPRNRVVVEDTQFPGVIYAWEQYGALGARLHRVPSEGGLAVPLERLLDAIDERTAIVLLSHAAYGTGALQDVAAVTARAHAVGARVMVDVYQTLGVVPFDVQAWGVDLLVGGSHKWLCGGPGAAFLWTRPGLVEQLHPRTTGWMGHARPFAFEDSLRHAPGPGRFMGGTPSVPAYFVACRAYEALARLDPQRVRAHNAALCEVVIDRAQDAGLGINSPLEHERRTGFVAVDCPGSQQVSATLIAEGFKHDWRPGYGLRIGPHFYNTEAEVHRFMDRFVSLAGAQ